MADEEKVVNEEKIENPVVTNPAEDPDEYKPSVNKWLDTFTALIWMSFVVMVSNYVGQHVSFVDSIGGIVLLIFITMAGMALSEKLPGPAVLWVSVLAVLLTSSVNPLGETFDKQYLSKIDFMSIATAILAYAGLALGKSIGLFKQVGWKIVVVAICVYTGTFVFAMLVAEVVLHMLGRV